jgi:prepilin-type processing-associated H-X9-DG protein
MVVVLSVLLILIALLFPGFGRLAQRMETVTCASQLRQIHIATSAYVAEHNGNYPDPWRWVWSDRRTVGQPWIEWAEPDTVERGTLFEYMGGDTQSYLCPSFKKMAELDLNPQLPAGLTAYVGYSMNVYLHTWAENLNTWPPHVGKHATIFRSQVQRPSRFALYADEGTVKIPGVNNIVINNLIFGVGEYNTPTDHLDGIAGYHNIPRGDVTFTRGKGNVVFADGHVELVDPYLSKEIGTPEIYK